MNELMATAHQKKVVPRPPQMTVRALKTHAPLRFVMPQRGLIWSMHTVLRQLRVMAKTKAKANTCEQNSTKSTKLAGKWR